MENQPPHDPMADVSGEYLNAILMTMAGSLVVIGTDNTIKMINQATTDLTGYTQQDLMGQPLDTLLEGGVLTRPTDKLGKKGFVRHGERIFKTKDGQRVPVSFSSAIMRDQHKRVTGIVCIAQDISPLKQVERALNDRITQLGILHQVDEELTHMMSLNRVLTMALDITMRLCVADAGGIALIEGDQMVSALAVGYPSAFNGTEYLNNGILQRVAQRQDAELVRDVRIDPDYNPVLPSTRAIIAIPLISQDRLIGILHLESTRNERFTTEMLDFLRLITARIAASINNTELYETSREQLEELQRLYDQVRVLEEVKTDMIRIAAHDLRNPLNNLMMSAKVMRKALWEQLSESMRERIRDIEESAKRMQRITADILSLERINKAATGEFLTVVDLETIVQQAYEAHFAQARAKGQDYRLELPGSALFVRGESVELHEAAANFIGNAIKYTPENGSIYVSLSCTPDKVIFEVKDNGYGIPEDQQGRLFQPFFRAKTAETETIDGTGLGLHLVKNIIERHKGKIRFQSKRGEGSIFGFELPLIKETNGVSQHVSA